jgi:hypothetical protein
MVAAAADPELVALPTSRSSNGRATRDDAPVAENVKD